MRSSWRFVRGALLLACLFGVGVWLASCSRTGAIVWDHPRALDGGAARDAQPPNDAELVTAIPLSHALVDVVFVVDRSGSMQLPMDEGSTASPSRWDALTSALERALDAVDPEVVVGAKIYPDRVADDVFEPAALCATSPDLTIAPSPVGRSRLIERMRAGGPPRGGTPTAEAISVALDALSSSPLARHAIVLITDGAPNCNPETGVPRDRCVCSTDRDECRGDAGDFLCLDDVRTLSTIDRAVSAGVPVIVVGIDDPQRPDLAMVLDRMAVAGGRPRPEGSSHRFHSARSSSELEAALGEIGAGLSACTFVPDGSGVLGGDMTLEIGSATVPESRTDGWTLSTVATNAVELHGSYCELALRRDRPIVARVRIPIGETMELTVPLTPGP